MSSKIVDPAFQGVGQKQGLEIWRIENFQPVPLPKSDYGKFYMGDSYIVLHTNHGKSGASSYDIHFWIGKDTSQDESGTAAIKTVELDAVLGGRAVQHRELQGHESDKFLSYFKPCIVPIEGGIASGFKTPEEEVFETRLYVCKGKRVVKLKQVPFARSSLNHDDVFILDTEKKIYQFNGANSNIQERAKALEVIQFLKETYHDGVCAVAVVDDGKLDTESDSGEFWVVFGGFAPLGRKVTHDDDVIPETTPAKLYSITGGKVNLIEGELSKSLLESNKCYLLDCGSEIFVWVGKATQVDERKAATQAVEEFVTSNNRPKATRTTRLSQGHETNSFKSNFDSWPTASTASGGDEGRGKVAAMLKQQKLAAKGMAKTASVHEEVPLLEGGGKMEVWYIDGNAKTPLPKEDVGKFHTGDCYIVFYSYHSGERREDYFLCCWIGKNSIQEDQKTSAKLANAMFNSHKGRPVQGRVFEGNEPSQFIALFQPMVVLKGGLSTGYKKSIEAKGLKDESYTADCVALFHISGTEMHNTKALQVDAAATSLNSNECFLLQSGSSAVFTWYGTQSTREQQELAAKVAELMKPGVARKHCKEGTETSAFWSALGGRESYATKEKESNETIRDPHLFTFSLNKGKFKVEEVYNFSQDDLLPEDILVLDTHAEVFVWVGQCADAKEKQNALEFGQQYIDMAVSLEGLSPKVTLYKVTEGNEPCFFTVFFSWDSHRATMLGNSFQQKMTLLFGASQPSAPKPSGPSQGSQRAAAVAALSNVLTAEKKDGSPRKSACNTPSVTSPQSDVKSEADPYESHDLDDSGSHQEMGQDGCTYSYDQLKSKSENPAPDIDLKRREAYLSDEEFETIFGMPKEAFYKMPKWKQDKHKKEVDLF